MCIRHRSCSPSRLSSLRFLLSHPSLSQSFPSPANPFFPPVTSLCVKNECHQHNIISDVSKMGFGCGVCCPTWCGVLKVTHRICVHMFSQSPIVLSSFFFFYDRVTCRAVSFSLSLSPCVLYENKFVDQALRFVPRGTTDDINREGKQLDVEAKSSVQRRSSDVPVNVPMGFPCTPSLLRERRSHLSSGVPATFP